MVLLAVCGSFLFSVAACLASKNCSNVVRPERQPCAYPLFLIVNCVLSCVFYFFYGKCRIPINRTTALYALAFGILCFIALLLSLVIYRFFDIATVNVFGNIGNMLLTVVLGILLFSEAVTLQLIVKCVLMCIAVLFSVRSTKSEQAFNWKHLYLLIASVVCSAATSLISKAYVSAPDNCGDASFCFYINVFVTLFAVIWLLLIWIQHPTEPFSLRFGTKQTLSTALLVVISGGQQLLTLFLLSKMNVSLLSPVIAALGLIAGALSSLMYREKLNRFTVIAILLSMISVFL